MSATYITDDGNVIIGSDAADVIRNFYVALTRINQVSSPNPERTFDRAIRDLEHITDIARAAVARGIPR